MDKRILEEVITIPYGKVVSYSHIAMKVNCHPRRVAIALKRNPYPLLIPCHRVVYKNGFIGGYLGINEGKIIKKKILEREGVRVTNDFYINKFLYSTI